MERKKYVDKLRLAMKEDKYETKREKTLSTIRSYHEELNSNSMKEEVLKILELLDETKAMLYDRDISEIVGCNIQYAKHIRLDRKNEHGTTYFEGSEKISQKLKNEVLERDNQQCVFCGKEKDLVIHHIIPVSEDGDTEKENLATLCEDCHLEAHGGSYTNSLNYMPYRTIDGFWNKTNHNDRKG